MIEPPPDTLTRERDGHEQAFWDRERLLETAREEPQAEPKEAEIAPILAMEPFQPTVADGADPEIADPKIGQAGGDQQAREPGRIAEMARVELEAATFLVGEKGLNMRAFAIQLQGILQVGDIRHEIDRRVIRRFPDRQQAHRPVGRVGHPRGSHGAGLAAHRFQITDLAIKSMRRKTDLRRGAADILPAQLAQRRLQVGAVELTIAEEDDRSRGRHDGLHVGDQRAMARLGEVSLGPRLSRADGNVRKTPD